MVPEIWCVTDVIVISHFWLFLPFYPLNSVKNQNFEKMKKCPEILSFYICVLKIIIRWCMVPEIWCVTDVIVTSHFGLFFALLPPKQPKKLKLMKKTLGDIIILHISTKNYDQMMYGSWDMAHDRCNWYSSFWAIFSYFFHFSYCNFYTYKPIFGDE